MPRKEMHARLYRTGIAIARHPTTEAEGERQAENIVQQKAEE